MRLDKKIEYIFNQLPLPIKDADWFLKNFREMQEEAKILEDFVEALNQLNTLQEKRNEY